MNAGEMSQGGGKEAEGSEKKRRRMVFIDFRALFFGEVSRADIVDFFGISPAAATRDLAAYIREYGGRIVLNGGTKTYRPTADFVPVFEHPIAQVLTALSQGFGEAQNDEAKSLIPAAIPRPLSLPNLEILAPISRAIHLRRAVSVIYHSYSSGRTERELVPHALINNGSRWHVRAYDRLRKQFNDFVLTRLSQVKELPQVGLSLVEQAAQDIQWTRIAELELVPHPHQERPEITGMDFNMKDGVLIIKERAALVGYLLRQWNVDCSMDHSEKSPSAQCDLNHRKGEEIRLWLRNSLALYGIESAKIAPGYKQPAGANLLPGQGI